MEQELVFPSLWACDLYNILITYWMGINIIVVNPVISSLVCVPVSNPADN